MLTPELIQQIRQLLAEGRLSQRKIAQVTGASRGSIAAIALGKRPDYQALQQERETERAQIEQPSGRCPECGLWCIMPCCRCRTERLIREGRLVRPPEEPEEEVKLELRDNHRRRYKRVRARHLARLRRGELP